MIKKTIFAAFVAIGLMAAPVVADGVKLGTLTCQFDGNVGLLIGSVNRGECTFRETNGNVKTYDASFSRIGVDVGVTGNKTVVWSVFGVDGRSNGGLSGSYTGVNAEATAIVGIGANALIGGFQNGIVLNPVSVSGQTGLNVAAGVATLRLN